MLSEAYTTMIIVSVLSFGFSVTVLVELEGSSTLVMVEAALLSASAGMSAFSTIINSIVVFQLQKIGDDQMKKTAYLEDTTVRKLMPVARRGAWFGFYFFGFSLVPHAFNSLPVFGATICVVVITVFTAFTIFSHAALHKSFVKIGGPTITNLESENVAAQEDA